MLPPYDCTDCEPCCTTFHDVAQQVLDVASEGLMTCAGSECCDEMTFFVAHGPNVSEPTGDYLAVWMAQMDFAPPVQPSRGLRILIPRAAFGVKLMETGYPLPSAQNGTVLPAQTREVDHASRHSLGHAEAVMRSVINAAETKAFGCGYLGMTPLTPVPAMGGLIGWQFGVTIELKL